MVLPAPIRSWLAQHARSLVVISASLIFGLAVAHFLGSCRRPAPPTATEIKAFQQANAELREQVDSLQSENGKLNAARITISAQRDSLRHASSAATHRIVAARATLPSAAVVPDSALRPLYQVAVATLDSSLVELSRRDSIESSYRRDSTLAAQEHTNDSLSLALRLAQIDTTQAEADLWHHAYDQANKAAHPLCGRKCGVVVGVITTVLSAIALHAVVH